MCVRRVGKPFHYFSPDNRNRSFVFFFFFFFFFSWFVTWESWRICYETLRRFVVSWWFCKCVAQNCRRRNSCWEMMFKLCILRNFYFVQWQNNEMTYLYLVNIESPRWNVLQLFWAITSPKYKIICLLIQICHVNFLNGANFCKNSCVIYFSNFQIIAFNLDAIVETIIFFFPHRQSAR